MRRRLSPETAQRSRKKYNRGAGQTVTKRRYVLEVIATGSSMEAGWDWGSRSGDRR